MHVVKQLIIFLLMPVLVYASELQKIHDQTSKLKEAVVEKFFSDHAPTVVKNYLKTCIIGAGALISVGAYAFLTRHIAYLRCSNKEYHAFCESVLSNNQRDLFKEVLVKAQNPSDLILNRAFMRSLSKEQIVCYLSLLNNDEQIRYTTLVQECMETLALRAIKEGVTNSTPRDSVESQKFFAMDAKPRAVSCCPHGRIIAAAFDSELKSNTSFLQVWNIDSGKCLLYLVHSGPVSILALDSQGARIAFGSNTSITVYNVQTGETELAISLKPTMRDYAWAAFANRWSELCDESVRITSLSFNERGTRLAASTNKGHLRVWDITTGVVYYETKIDRSIEQLSFINNDEILINSGGHSVLTHRAMNEFSDPLQDQYDGPYVLHEIEKFMDRAVVREELFQGLRAGYFVINVLGTSSYELRNQCYPDKVVKQISCKGIGLCCCTDDGFRIAVGSLDRDIQVWDVSRGRQICILHAKITDDSYRSFPSERHVYLGFGSSPDEIIVATQTKNNGFLKVLKIVNHPEAREDLVIHRYNLDWLQPNFPSYRPELLLSFSQDLPLDRVELEGEAEHRQQMHARFLRLVQ